MKKYISKYNSALIKEILKNAVPNFAEKVEVIYRALNWTWEDDLAPPNTQDIIEHTDELIDGIEDLSSTECIHCSAGIQVGWRKFDKDQIEIVLEVVYDHYNQYYSPKVLKKND